MTRKWIMRALCILCLAAMLTGCGREPEVTETTIEVKKNGQVVHTIIEDFSESYYNLDELESTIQQACDTYNASAGKEAVVLKAAKENDDHTVTVVMQYADASAYSAFNKLALFVGTVKDAFNAGYDLNVTLSSLKGDGEQIGKEDLLKMGEKHIAVVREAVNVRVWDKVRYGSEDVEATANAKTVSVTDADMLTYIQICAVKGEKRWKRQWTKLYRWQKREGLYIPVPKFTADLQIHGITVTSA